MNIWNSDRLKEFRGRIEDFYKRLLRRRRVLLFLTGLVCILGLSGLPKLHVNNSMDVWFSDGTPSYLRYEEFTKVFGRDEYLFIALDLENVFTEKNLSLLARLTDTLTALPGVIEVLSLPSATDVSSETGTGGMDGILVREVRDRIGVEPAESIRSRILSEERFVGTLVSADGRVAVLLVRFADAKEGCKRVDEIARILGSETVPYHFGGYIFAQREMDRLTFRDYFLFGSICLVLLSVLFWVLFDDFFLTAIFVGDCMLTVGVVLGAMGHLGVPIHLMTGILPPLLMAMAIADDIHLVERFMRYRRESGIQAPVLPLETSLDLVARSTADVAIPSLLSAITTFAGFFSLSGGQVPAIGHFGFWSGVGILFTYLFSYLTVPVLLTYVSPQRSAHREFRRLPNWERHLFDFCVRRRRTLLAIFAALCVAAGFGIHRIVIDTQLTNFFKPGSGFMKSMDFIEEHFGNTGPVEIVLTSPVTDGLKDPSFLLKTEHLMERLKTLPKIQNVLSINPVLKSTTRAVLGGKPEDYRLPDRRDLLEQELLILSLSPSGEDSLNRYVTPAWTQFRIQVRLPRMSNNEALALFDQMESVVRDVFGPHQAFYMSGVVEAYARLDRFILDSQLKSLGITLVMVTLVFWIQVGRPLWAILALLPNVFPIVLMFATMGWCGITLNVATATVAAITLGLADDDTVFFFYEYVRRRRSGQSARVALPEALEECGRPLWIATLLNVVGFSLFIFSSFRPTAYFGFLTSEVWILAVAAEFTLLPALLLTLDRK